MHRPVRKKETAVVACGACRKCTSKAEAEGVGAQIISSTQATRRVFISLWISCIFPILEHLYSNRISKHDWQCFVKTVHLASNKRAVRGHFSDVLLIMQRPWVVMGVD